MKAHRKEPLATTIGTCIAGIREDMLLTQMELGEMCNQPNTAISHYECGRRSPSVENLVAITEALDVSLDYLVGRTIDPQVRR